MFASFDENYVETRGRSLSVTRIENSKFSNNHAEQPVAAPADESAFMGGAITVRSSAALKISLDDLEFRGNRAWKAQDASLRFAVRPAAWADSWHKSMRFSVPAAAAAWEVSVPAAGKLLEAEPPEIDESKKLPKGEKCCYSERPAGAEVQAVVIHSISAEGIDPERRYDLETILGIFTGGSSTAEPFTSAHYLITREGVIYRLVDEGKRAWHAGLSRMPGGAENVNDFSIGIEIVRTLNEEPTNSQYDALVKLLCDIKRRHPALTIPNVVGHDTIRHLWNGMHPDTAAVQKYDPGPLFHWTRLTSELGARGF